MPQQKSIFYTFAYNAEKTLPRTIESVLTQTHDALVYYCIDNGSTDGTGAIIRDYAAKDSRLIHLANKQNHVWEPGNSWFDIVMRHDDEDMLCFLDADDEYKPDFLEKMLAFMARNALDIAGCGNDYIDAPSEKLQRIRQLNETLILEGDGFSEHFALYLRFMGTMWGKLYKCSVLRKHDFSRTYLGIYANDTFFTIENFRNANRVGILADSFYKYYISKHSASNQWDATRIESARKLDEAARAFLIDKCGFISPLNNRFITRAYLSVILVTLRTLFRADLRLQEKLGHLRDIFKSDNTRELFRRGYIWGDLLRIFCGKIQERLRPWN